MGAEAIHALVDSFNQALLMFGLYQASRSPDKRHQYGYGRAAFVWSLVSAMGVFWLGCGVTVYHGITTMLSPPETIQYVWLTASVLFSSFCIDGFVLFTVLRGLYQRRPPDISFFRYLRSIKDPMIISVLLEDITACGGVLVAGLGIGATVLTGNIIWDGIASVSIGGLLGIMASALVAMNNRFLIGQAIDSDIELKIQRMIQKRPSIEAVYKVQSQWVGPSTFTFKAEVDFNGTYFARELQDLGYADGIMTQVNNKTQLSQLLAWYAEDVILFVEREIREIEEEIRSVYPQAAYIELEPASTVMSMKLLEFKLRDQV